MIADEFARALPAFLGEPDDEVARLGIDQIEELLHRILAKRLIGARPELFAGNGPFSTLYARVEAAYTLGVVNREFADKLHLISAFRHGIALRRFHAETLSSPVVAELAGVFREQHRAKDLERTAKRLNQSPAFVVLRYALALLIVNLVKVYRETEPIDGSKAHSVVSASVEVSPGLPVQQGVLGTKS